MNQYEQDMKTQAENKKKKDDKIMQGLLIGGAILSGIALYNAHVNNNVSKETLEGLFDKQNGPDTPPDIPPVTPITPNDPTPISPDLGTEQMNTVKELPIPKGRVISASYKTDIPAFYSRELMNAIDKGEIVVPGSWGKGSTRVSLKPEDVQVMELWTKNPSPMLKNGSLQKLKDTYGNRFYFQYSVNNYDKALEGNVPDNTIETFKQLSNEIGPERVIWRYDPIIMSKGEGPYTVQSHLDNYSKLAEQLSPYTKHNVISFVDEYSKIKNNFNAMGLRAPTNEEMNQIAEGISKINEKYGLDISTCAEGIDLDKYGIRHGACTDPIIIEALSGEKAMPKANANRSNCGCADNIDIGTFNTCKNGCIYCYATKDNPLNSNEHTLTGFRSLSEMYETVLKPDKGTQQMHNIIYGNIMDTNAKYVLHQVNNKGVMGAGLAKTIKPDLSDFNLYKNNPLSLGSVIQIPSKTNPNRTYLNLVGQDGYGRDRQYTDYKAIEQGLNNILYTVPAGSEIAIPWNMGAGLGGGDWSKIYNLINSILGNKYKITFYKYK